MATANDSLITPQVEGDDAPRTKSAAPAPDPTPLPDTNPSEETFSNSWIEKWLLRFARPLLAIYWPLLFYSTHTKMPESIDRAMNQVRHLNPDKFMHFGTYLPLTLLAVFSSLLGRRAPFIANLGFGCMLVAIYSVVDEVTQGFVGRTPSAADIMADLWAVAFVFLALMWTHPSRARTPMRLLISRTLLVLLIPLAGIALFQKGFGLALWRLFPTWTPWIRGDVLDHVVCAAVLCWLLLAAAPLGDGRRKANFIVVTVFMLLVAPLIEWLQSLLSKRGAEWEDVIGHLIGMAIGLGIWLQAVTLMDRRAARA